MLRQYMTELYEAIWREGFHLRERDDLSEWVRFLKDAPKNNGANPTFDPEFSDVNPINSRWIQLTEVGSDETVSCGALRVFETADFYEEIFKTGRLFNRSGMHVDLVSNCNPPRMSGRVTHLGGFYLHPKLRNRNLAWLMARFLRARAFERFAPNWHTALFVEQYRTQSSLVTTSYGYSDDNLYLAIDGHFPVNGKQERVLLSVLSEQVHTAEMSRDFAWLHAHKHGSMRDLVAASKRAGQL